jgi:hypothetical protein
MTRDRQLAGEELFTQVDIATGDCDPPSTSAAGSRDELAPLLRQLVGAQDRQNELLEELVNAVATAHRQRTSELSTWRQAHPRLARQCRRAGEVLARVQARFLDSVTNEVLDNAEAFDEGDFYLNEFLDRFGPRLAHLNGVVQVLTHLGGQAEAEPSGLRDEA